MSFGEVMLARMLISIVLVSGSGAFLAQEAGQAEEPPYEMAPFQLVFLREVFLEEPVPEHRIPRIKTTNDQYLANLLDDDAALIAGAVIGHDELKQVAVLDVDSNEQAQAIFERSPAARIAKQEIDVFTWWAAKGLLQKTDDPSSEIDCFLGLLIRPDRPGHYPKEELARIQEGHLANLQKMADSGDLVIAGPVESDDPGGLRGILIFRTRDTERIERLLADDPAIKARRLRFELYRWRIPEGILPEWVPPQP